MSRLTRSVAGPPVRPRSSQRADSTSPSPTDPPPDPAANIAPPRRPENRRPKKIFVDKNGAPLTFHLPRGPRRADVRENIERHGGELIDIPHNAWMRLAEPDAPVTKPGIHSTEYIKDCVFQSELLDKEGYEMSLKGLPPGKKLNTRTPYSAADKQIIREVIEKYPRAVSSNSLWEGVAAKHPHHTWQSWRDHALKHIMPFYKLVRRQTSLSHAGPAATPANGSGGKAIEPASNVSKPSDMRCDGARGSVDKGKQPAAREADAPEEHDEDAMEIDKDEGEDDDGQDGEQDDEAEDDAENGPKQNKQMDASSSKPLIDTAKLHRKFTKEDRSMITKYLQLDYVDPEAESSYKQFGKLNRQHTWKEWEAYSKAYILPAMFAKRRIQQDQQDNDSATNTRGGPSKFPASRLRTTSPSSPALTPRKRRATTPEVDLSSSKRLKMTGGGVILRSPGRKVPKLLSGPTTFNMEAEDDGELDEKLTQIARASRSKGKGVQVEVEDSQDGGNGRPKVPSETVIDSVDNHIADGLADGEVEEVEEVDDEEPQLGGAKDPVIEGSKPDLDKICGVLSPGMKLCEGDLSCEAHTTVAKRAVTGRSKPFEDLYLKSLSGPAPRFGKLSAATKTASKLRKSLGVMPDSSRSSESPIAGPSSRRATSASPALPTTTRRSPRNKNATVAPQQQEQQQEEQQQQPQAQKQRPKKLIPQEDDYARLFTNLLNKYTPRYERSTISEALFMTCGHFGLADKLLEGGMEVSAVGEKGRKKIWLGWEDKILERWVKAGRKGELEGEVGKLVERKGEEAVRVREKWLGDLKELAGKSA